MIVDNSQVHVRCARQQFLTKGIVNDVDRVFLRKTIEDVCMNRIHIEADISGRGEKDFRIGL